MTLKNASETLGLLHNIEAVPQEGGELSSQEKRIFTSWGQRKMGLLAQSLFKGLTIR